MKADAARAERRASAWGQAALEYILRGDAEMAYRASRIAARNGHEALGLIAGTIS